MNICVRRISTSLFDPNYRLRRFDNSCDGMDLDPNQFLDFVTLENLVGYANATYSSQLSEIDAAAMKTQMEFGRHWHNTARSN
jgi:hypothetical protein